MAAPKPDLTGRTVAGKYVIESFIGGGAMGAVYRARQAVLDKVVAIKVLHRELAVASPTFVARFQREARAASRLDHPNSIRVIDYGEEPDGLLYIAMELAEGRDLYHLTVGEPQLADERIVDILSQVLAALAVAHEMGVIHRDLKPENILVAAATDDEGNPVDHVKVCDFGIATITDSRSDKESGEARGVTTAGSIIGTPEYMAPEQARGEPLDGRSDLYSVGVILFRLLTGTLPFQAESALGVAVKQIYEEPSHPSELRLGVHPELERVCLKAMRKNPADRYQNAREMRSALRTALDPSRSSTLELAPFAVRDALGASQSRRTPVPVGAPISAGAPTLAGSPISGGASVSLRGSEPTLLLESTRPVESARLHDSTPAPASNRAAPESSPDAPESSQPRPGFRLHYGWPAAAAGVLIAIAVLRASPPVDEPGPSNAGSASSPPHTATATLPLAAVPTTDQVNTAPGVGSIPGDVAVAPPASGSASGKAPLKGSLADLSASPSASTSAAPAETAAPAPTVAATAEPAVTAAPSSVVTAAPSSAASATSATPTATLDVSTARVAVAGVSVTGGIAGSSVRNALSRAAFTSCYKDALRRAGTASGGTATLHLSIDETGRVRSASAGGMGFLPGAKSCVEGAARGAQIANVDTGDATADVTLSFVPQ